MANWRILPASIIGTDKTTQLALLKIEASELAAVALGDASKLKNGRGCDSGSLCPDRCAEVRVEGPSPFSIWIACITPGKLPISYALAEIYLLYGLLSNLLCFLFPVLRFFALKSGLLFQAFFSLYTLQVPHCPSCSRGILF